ncbi:substrate-binding domain-containing protein [Atopococcus tabaci]|uniref:substrate-binding domain-containing protein n=1 Tax=Atopococcus tabaci TaxID=269774 RepID=UPI00240A4B19|nr:substrate-binding domain-containing protein [Atopococcus tabaci]
MRKTLKLLVVLFAFTLLSACSNEAAASDPGEDEVKIGFSMSNLNDTFLNYVLNATQEEAAERGIDIRVENAEDDLIRQQDQINALIHNEVDGLIVIPVDTSAMQPITDAAQEAGIPLIYLNRNPYTDKEEEMPEGVYYVGSEEKKAGHMQMEYIGELMGGEGGIGILLGILGSEAQVQRTAGVKEVIQEKYPDIEVLAEETAKWQRDQAVSITENWLMTYGDRMNAIVSNNDEMALGALQAIQNNGRDDMYLIGMDAVADALTAVKEGKLAGTVFQDAVGQGSAAVDVMDQVLKGEAPEEQAIFVPYELITAENVDKYMK